MKTLNVDIETYSPEPLAKTGVYKYAEHEDFELLLFGYSVDGAESVVVNVAQGEAIPEEIVDALFNRAVIKRAFNAAFEIVCLSSHFGRPLSVKQWRCTMVLALYLGLPGNLYDVSRIVCPGEQQKSGVGRSLITYFCLPCKPTKTNGGRTRNLPHHDPDKWELFKGYCGQDVIAEAAVCDRLLRWAPPDSEQTLWTLDQEINDRGLLIDQDLVTAAIAIDDTLKAKHTAEFFRLTGIGKATQVAKIKTWLADEHDLNVESLNKESIKGLLKLNTDTDVERVLQLRQELSKSSVAKYRAIAASVCADGRVRGLLQFYGANRTGRWAGRLVQIQNLPKSSLTYQDLALAGSLVKNKDIELLQLLFGHIPALLSQLIRTTFVAPEGKAFVVVDFSAIEARVVAWAAREDWRMEVFRTHGRIYEASAAEMFKVPLASIGKQSPLRQKGKVAELALGYHGGVGALIKMGALTMGLTEAELPDLVSAWRTANPNIMSFGRGMELHAKRCLRTRRAVSVADRYRFRYESGMLFLDLPSGRSLCYVKPRIEQEGAFQNITYDGMDQVTKKWGRVETYAGKLLENYTQAVARDCLAFAMPALESAGLPIVAHVHDEAIVEVDLAKWPSPTAALTKAEEIFSRSIPWAAGLPLGGDGFVSDFYRKGA